MVEFARLFIEILQSFWKNIVIFFTAIFKAFGKFFGTDVISYFNLIGRSVNDFNFLDWVVAIIVFFVNIVFLTLLVILMVKLIKKYLKFRRTEIEKDDLKQEIATLSQQNLILNDEKNEILKLKMETFGMNPDLFEGKDNQKKKDSRFSKLIAVDEKYDFEVLKLEMSEDDQLSLEQLIDRFVNFAANKLKLYYDHKVARNFFAGLGTSKIIILEGISGTGKTSLPYAMGQFFKNPSAIIPVQPSWRDRSEMIGYLNEFTKKFNESDFLKELYEVGYREDLNFIVLDEMNLARIEYYFADFLSILEMPNSENWKIAIVPTTETEDPRLIVEGKLIVPQNVWFVGTANKDDSTFTISDKVYDRAVSIEMNVKADEFDAPETEAIDLSYDYLNTLYEKAKAEHPLSEKNDKNIKNLDLFITDKFKITFGNRIRNQILQFVPIYVASGGTEEEALDYIITTKILRKFEALNLPYLQKELDELIVLLNKLFGKNTFNVAFQYIERLKKYA